MKYFFLVFFLCIHTSSFAQQHFLFSKNTMINQPGILDAYSGASAAYGIDELLYENHIVTDNNINSDTYNQARPYTIRVRRSSDNAIRSFLYSEVSDGTIDTWVGASNNGYVESWYSQGSAENHAVQLDVSRQPLIVENGVLITENNKAAIRFDGLDDCLLSNIFTPIIQPLAKVVIARFENSQPGYIIDGGATTRGVIGTNPSSFNRFRLFAGNTNGDYNNSGPSGLNEILIATFNGTASNLFRNNSSLGNVDPGVMGCDRVVIGKNGAADGQFFNGTIQVILIFNGDFTSLAQDLSNSLNSHFSIY